MKCKTCGEELNFEWLKKAGVPKSLAKKTKLSHQKGLCTIEPSNKRVKAVVKACEKSLRRMG